MGNILLFLSCSFVWGSTWFAITMQLGVVDSMWSICYRFGLAAILMWGYCWLSGVPVRFPLRQHVRLLFQGISFCGLSYWCVYESEKYISSGLSAILCTTIIYFNVLFGRLWLGNPVRRSVIAGGLLGSAGISMIFFPELSLGGFSEEMICGLSYSLAASVLFSLGCIAFEQNEKEGISVLSSVTMSMLYGSLFLAVFAITRGAVPAFEFTSQYILSLLYLSLFGSIVATTFYVLLIRRIGADRTAYVDVIYPVVALGFSTVFEGYKWSLLAGLGVLVILLGNLVAMGKLHNHAGKKSA